jgi:hypothetical protein
LKPEAHLRLEVDEPGILTLSLRSPRPTAPHLVVRVGGNSAGTTVEFLNGEAEAVVRLGRQEIEFGVAEIALISEAFVPSLQGLGGDSRELGVVLTGLAFRPDEPGPLCWWDE